MAELGSSGAGPRRLDAGGTYYASRSRGGGAWVGYRETAPRHLSVSQIGELHARLDGFAGQDFMVLADVRGLDSHEYAEEVFGQLVEAGWRPRAYAGKLPDVLDVPATNWGPVEIWIGVGDAEHPSAAAQALYDFFGDTKANTSFFNNASTTPKSMIRLVIGRRTSG